MQCCWIVDPDAHGVSCRCFYSNSVYTGTFKADAQHKQIFLFLYLINKDACLCTLQCLQHLDVSVLGQLVPKLCDLLKSGIGLGTKVNV